MLDRREREQLEDAYDAQVRFFNRKENEIDDYYNEFGHRSNNLMEIVRESFRGVDYETADSYLYQLEENLHFYARSCHEKIELLDEARHKARKEFYEKWES